MEWMKRAWQGEERLWVVFWIYGVLFGLIIGFISEIEALQNIGTTPGYLLLALQIAYGIWLYVSQWRCAFNADWAFWGYVVRVLIVIMVICWMLVALFLGGLMAWFGGMIGSGLTSQSECKKEVAAYVQNGGTDAEKFEKDCMKRHMEEMGWEIKPADGKNADPAEVKKSLPATTVRTNIRSTPSAEDHCRKNLGVGALTENVDTEQYIAHHPAEWKECLQNYINQANP